MILLWHPKSTALEIKLALSKKIWDLGLISYWALFAAGILYQKISQQNLLGFGSYNKNSFCFLVSVSHELNMPLGRPQVSAAGKANMVDNLEYCLLTQTDYVMAYDYIKKMPFYASYTLEYKVLSNVNFFNERFRYCIFATFNFKVSIISCKISAIAGYAVNFIWSTLV